MSNRQSGESLLRSRQNQRVQEARRLANDPRLARREGVLIADGTVVVLDALDTGLSPKAIFLDPEDSRAEDIRAGCAACSTRPILATKSVIAAISTLTTPQGAVGIFERPVQDPLSMLAAPGAVGQPIVSVLHGLQDPTNAGSLVRTALAMGLSGVISTEGTVDPFHPRAVRASMGASFRLPMSIDMAPALVWETLRRGGYRVLGLDPRGEALLDEITVDSPIAILLGHEGGGLDSETRKHCDLTVRIPMATGIESLGVAAAGAIVFYKLASGKGR